MLLRKMASAVRLFRNLWLLPHINESLTAFHKENIIALNIIRKELKDISQNLSDSNKIFNNQEASHTDSIQLYRLPNKELAFNPEIADERCRVSIISIPKAGTYLMGKILSQLGFIDTEIHAYGEGYFDYRNKTVEQKRDNILDYDTRLALDHTLSFIHEGQFVVGHFHYNNDVVQLLNNFAKIFVCRDLRDVVVSHMRWLAGTKRGGKKADEWRDLPEGPEKMLYWFETHGEFIFNELKKIVGWINAPDIFIVNFENLFNENKFAASIINLCDYLQISFPCSDWEEFRSSCIDVPTQTYSGSRTDRTIYWDKRVQDAFDAYGGTDLNRYLGYKQ